MMLGIVLISSALLLLLYNIREDNMARYASDMALANIQKNISEEISYGKYHKDPYEMTVKEIDGYGYIGYLFIPSLELELPIMSDWDYERLKIAPCRQFGSSKQDNLVIAGHNYTSHFGALPDLETGDILMFTDMDGITITYTVESIGVIEPTAVDVVKYNEWDLTLYTCTYGGKNRVIINCDRQDNLNTRIIG